MIGPAEFEEIARGNIMYEFVFPIPLYGLQAVV